MECLNKSSTSFIVNTNKIQPSKIEQKIVKKQKYNILFFTEIIRFLDNPFTAKKQVGLMRYLIVTNDCKLLLYRSKESFLTLQHCLEELDLKDITSVEGKKMKQYKNPSKSLFMLELFKKKPLVVVNTSILEQFPVGKYNRNFSNNNNNSKKKISLLEQSTTSTNRQTVKKPKLLVNHCQQQNNIFIGSENGDVINKLSKIIKQYMY